MGGSKPHPGLTPAQQRVLAFIAAFIEKHRYAPVWREICQHIGSVSTNACHQHIQQLERKGMVTRVKKLGRTLSLTDAGRDWLRSTEERRQLG
jgi:SOS-response transcriptional repressor LexA